MMDIVLLNKHYEEKYLHMTFCNICKSIEMMPDEILVRMIPEYDVCLECTRMI